MRCLAGFSPHGVGQGTGPFRWGWHARERVLARGGLCWVVAESRETPGWDGSWLRGQCLLVGPLAVLGLADRSPDAVGKADAAGGNRSKAPELGVVAWAWNGVAVAGNSPGCTAGRIGEAVRS